MSSSGDSLNFQDEGFNSVILSEAENTLEFRLNVKSEGDFKLWKDLYTNKTNSCFNVKRVVKCSGEKIVLHKVFMCQHGDSRNTGKKTSYTRYVLYNFYMKLITDKIWQKPLYFLLWGWDHCWKVLVFHAVIHVPYVLKFRFLMGKYSIGTVILKICICINFFFYKTR